MSGAKVGVFGQVTSLGLGMASMALLARLLSPEDFGLFAMASGVVAFLTVLVETGFPYALTQREGLRADQASTFFWFLSLSALTACAVGWGIAIPLGWILGRDELSGAIIALSCTLPLNALGMTHAVLLRRQIMQGVIVSIAISSSLVSTCAAVACAWLEFGWWSLIVQALVASAARCAGYWWFCDWRPGMPSRGTGIRSLIRTGSVWSSSEFTGLVRRSADQLLVGWWWGAEVLGFYSRGMALATLMLTNGVMPMTAAIWPALAQIQSNPERLRSAVLQASEVICFVAVPSCVFLTVCAQMVVAILLGAQWDECTHIMQVSLVGMLFASTLGPVSGLYAAATGKVRALARLSWISVLIGLTTMLAALPFGPLAVASVLSIVAISVSFLGLRLVMERSGIGSLEIVRCLAWPLGCSLVASTATSLVIAIMPGGTPALLRLAVAGVAMSLAYSGVWCISRRGRSHFVRMISLALGARRARIAVDFAHWLATRPGAWRRGM